MAIKTFSDGNSLPASDINTYLANSGLVYVKSQTVGTAVSSVSVTDVFSATYDNYKIIYTSGASSAHQALQLHLTGATSAYYAGLFRMASDATTSNLGTNNQSTWLYAGYGGVGSTTLDVDLYDPFIARFTRMKSVWADERDTAANSGFYGTQVGVHRTATSYTGFTIVCGANITGGQIIVYGYRKA
jgi:hypothetical protein